MTIRTTRPGKVCVGFGPLFVRSPKRFLPMALMRSGRRFATQRPTSCLWWWSTRGRASRAAQLAYDREDAYRAQPDYQSVEFDRGYADGLNDRAPDPTMMRHYRLSGAAASYEEGWNIGWAEQECPLEYRRAKDDGT